MKTPQATNGRVLSQTARNEIWFRKIYLGLICSQKVTTIFRPGDRSNGHPKSFREGEIATIKIIERVGADWANLPGTIVPNFERRVAILQSTPVRLGDLQERDFNGSSPDVASPEALRFHLGVVYNLYPYELPNVFIVTKTVFEYL